MHPLIKLLLTAVIITAVSEIAKRFDRIGALVAALPLVTLLVMTWLHIEGAGDLKIGSHAHYTFWYVLPTLPLLLAIDPLLKAGLSYWTVLLIYMVGTTVLFLLTAALARLFDVFLLP